MDPVKTPPPAVDYFGYRPWAKVFLVVAIFLTTAGVIIVFAYSSPSGSNNFLFSISRGMALICTGISAAVVSVVLVLFAILEQSER